MARAGRGCNIDTDDSVVHVLTAKQTLICRFDMDNMFVFVNDVIKPWKCLFFYTLTFQVCSSVVLEVICAAGRIVARQMGVITGIRPFLSLAL